MNPGKVPGLVLERSVFKTLQQNSVINENCPAPGMDYGVVHSDETSYVCTMDPVIGTVKDAGKLAVITAANNIATAGAEPVGMLLSVLMPEEMEEKQLKKLMRSIAQVSDETKLPVLGGHTASSSAVKELVVTVTGIGRVAEEHRISSQGAKTGQDIIMTGYAGLSGTSKLAKAHGKELLTRYSSDFIQSAKDFEEHLLITKEARIAVDYGVSAMHDLHEKGVFGGLWELAAASKVGLRITLEDIPMRQETVEISEFFELNPYKLLCGGSLLIVTDHGRELVERLESNGIPAAMIGSTTAENGCIIVREGEEGFLEPPKMDEIYLKNI